LLSQELESLMNNLEKDAIRVVPSYHPGLRHSRRPTLWPFLATYASALFPALAVVGALNLAMISRQEQRESTVKAEKATREAERQARRQRAATPISSTSSSHLSRTAVLNTSLDLARQTRRAKRDARMDALLTFYATNPSAGVTAAGQAIGVSRQTVYTYLAPLEACGRLSRNNGVVHVLEPD
jgi:hypothetical protein